MLKGEDHNTMKILRKMRGLGFYAASRGNFMHIKTIL